MISTKGGSHDVNDVKDRRRQAHRPGPAATHVCRLLAAAPPVRNKTEVTRLVGGGGSPPAEEHEVRGRKGPSQTPNGKALAAK